MSDPTTGYENHGGWSSLAEERAYLRELDQRPGVSVREAGRSVLGNSLWCVDLGNPAGPTLLVVGGVHGRELSGREAALIWARTLSTPGDTAVDAYLAAHRVVIVPTANPDGAAMFARDNANGVNLNRDYAQLIQPETRAVKRVINDVRPQIILDLHDVDASLDEGFDFRPYAGGMPGIVPELQQAATACLDEAKAATGAAGFTSKDYNTAMVPYASLSVIAAAFHAVGILSETSFRLRHPDRIEVATLMLEAVRRYHAEHQADLVAAVAESKRAAREATGDLVLCTGSFITTGVQRPDPGAFTPEWDIPAELAELHGITVEEGAVSTRQEARSVIAALFHPDAYQNIVGKEWPPDPVTPDPSPAGSFSLSVKQGGVIRRVREVWVKRDGVRRRVRSAVVKQGGVRRSL